MIKTVKTTHIVALLAAAVLFTGCAGSANRKKLEAWKAEVKQYQMHGPQEFYDIIDASDYVYHVTVLEKDDALDSIDFIPVIEDTPSISPYYRMETAFGGMFLMEAKPEGEIRKLFTAADKELYYKRWDEGIALYRKALALDSTYFKTWSFLGNACFHKGDYPNAVTALEKAVALNPIGFEEYAFLADAYLKLGDLESAFDRACHAFMLNKHGAVSRAVLADVVREKKLVLRRDRLTFPVAIRPTKKRKVIEILVKSEEDFHWVALGNCMACWEMEKKFESLGWGYEEQEYLNELMIKECLLNQAVYTHELRKSGKRISLRERMLQEAVRDGYMNALLIWEIAAERDPELIFYLPQDQKDRIVSYIKRFVFKKAGW